jgi:hypothetical protein
MTGDADTSAGPYVVLHVRPEGKRRGKLNRIVEFKELFVGLNGLSGGCQLMLKA